MPPSLWSLSSQNKTPLTPAQVFQDVPSDHAFKTMTMEPFPHSGQQLASVHPCKHASVMKKFIDRMEASRPSTPPAASAYTSDAEAKKRWGTGIGGMVRRVTGGEKPPTAAKEEGEVEGGVQVDFYLVIVSPDRRHKLMTCSF